MSHTNSKTWIAPKMVEQEKFEATRVNLAMMELIPRSPFVPTTMDEWLAHRIAFAEDAKREEVKKISNRETTGGSDTGGGRVPVDAAFGGIKFNDNRSAVLALPSTWTPSYKPTDKYPEAMWPSQEEMKEEGDERKTSGYGRFPALPRVPGNETVVWKQKMVVESYPFDRVWAVPKLELKKPTYDESIMKELIGNDILKMLDC